MNEEWVLEYDDWEYGWTESSYPLASCSIRERSIALNGLRACEGGEISYRWRELHSGKRETLRDGEYVSEMPKPKPAPDPESEPTATVGLGQITTAALIGELRVRLERKSAKAVGLTLGAVMNAYGNLAELEKLLS